MKVTSLLFPSLLFLFPLCLHAVETTGETLYQQNCGHCHSSGKGPVPAYTALSQLPAEQVFRSLESGSMRIFGAMLLTRDERISVAEYISGENFHPPDPNQFKNPCKVSGPGFDLNGSSSSWNGWSPDPANRRYQQATTLSAGNLHKLEIDWVFAFPGETMVNAQPTIHGKNVYVGSIDGNVYALDRESGCTRWKFKAETAVRGSVVIAAQNVDGKMRFLAFFGDNAANAYAVDAQDGRLVWSRKIDTHHASRLTAGFSVFEDRLFIPVSSSEEGLGGQPSYACCTFRGSILALDAATGRELWRKYTINEAASPMNINAHGVQQWGPSGAAVWAVMAVDEKRRTLYAVTGNNYSSPATETSDAVLALNIDSGEILWHYQGLAGDAWNTACLMSTRTNCPEPDGPDHDMAAHPVLLETDDGRGLVIAAQKTGVVHAVDRDSGKLVWKQRIGAGKSINGIQWGPASDGKLLYVAVSDIAFTNTDTLEITLDPEQGGGLWALDVSTGEIIWRAAPGSCAQRSKCSPAQSAAVSAIPGVVFSGQMSGILRAYSSSDGELLWEYDTVRPYKAVNQAPAMGGALDGPGLVIVDNQMFVTSGYSLWGGHSGNVLISFSLTE